MTPKQVRDFVDKLEAEINNGGFDQFFFNTTGNHTAKTIEALKLIGANHTAGIVESAAAKFPGSMPSTKRKERQEQLLEISPESDLFESLDDAFLEYHDDLAALVDQYDS